VAIESFGAPIISYSLHKQKFDRAWPAMACLLNAARTNFGPPGIFKRRRSERHFRKLAFSQYRL